MPEPRDARDEAVFRKFTAVTGIPVPLEVDVYLPEGGLFTKSWRIMLGLVIIAGLAWYQKYKADKEAEEAEFEKESAQYAVWKAGQR